MKEVGPYIAIAALLITLGGALYGWATSQGEAQAEIRQLRRDVNTLQETVDRLSMDFQGSRLEMARWIAVHEDELKRRGR